MSSKNKALGSIPSTRLVRNASHPNREDTAGGGGNKKSKIIPDCLLILKLVWASGYSVSNNNKKKLEPEIKGGNTFLGLGLLKILLIPFLYLRESKHPGPGLYLWLGVELHRSGTLFSLAAKASGQLAPRAGGRGWEKSSDF